MGIGGSGAGRAAESGSRPEKGFSFRRDVIPDVPWSVNVVTIDRSNPNLELHTTLPGGSAIGLTTLSEQIRTLPPALGRPLAGVNGDFYRNDGSTYNGDPKGLQIMRGELISAPCDWSCFWIDPAGQPHMTNVVSRFTVLWPDGRTTRFGLNEERRRDTVVLYTSRIGRSTGTTGGRELVLELAGSSPSLPLQAGNTYALRVREVREEGNTPLRPESLVLSIPRELVSSVPRVEAGTLLTLSTATSPDLKGVRTAIGGGPALVQGGEMKKWGLLQIRHPRSAIGWNDRSIYLVEVDGRQAGLSVGMTYSELADYMRNKLGCTDALNLDGGGSATLWVLGQVANSPSEGQERGMGNALVVVQRPDPKPAETPAR